MHRALCAAASLALIVLAASCATAPPPSNAQTAAPAPAAQPWMDATLTPDQRAELLLAQMTQAEKLTLVTGYWGSPAPWRQWDAPALSRHGAAGFVPGVDRLGIPPQWQSDAGMGVAQQGSVEVKLERTALPSGMAVAASWNPDVAFQGGAMIGAEARASGLNVQLAGGVDLVREPRNGRNFEYAGEDPLLAGVMAGAAVRGVQSNHIISTIKHYAFNDQETGRDQYSVVIDEAAARQSDLLAFEIALEQSQAQSVMCSYNRFLGDYACENDFLLNQVLKRDWRFPGYVMSDWGATHSTVNAANHGLDQENGAMHADSLHFGANLAAAIQAGQVPQARLDDMARRILHAMFAVGLFEHPIEGADQPIDFDTHARVSQQAAEQGMVLLKNQSRILPLSPGVASIVVIGGHADAGVLTGGGSSQVYPRGGNAAPGVQPTSWPGPVIFNPSSPLAAIRAHAPNARVTFDPGADLQAAAQAARSAQVAIVFVTQWTSESQDFPISLGDQDALVTAVARANPRTIVVLETGGPVLLPWHANVRGIVEAWFPGTNGGQAIANVLFGDVNPSGRLPVTFPTALDQYPHPRLDGEGVAPNTQFTVTYSEGAAVGYKWFDARRLEPLYPFGYGLSYTHFAHSDLNAALNGDALQVSFTVRNTGDRAGADVAQVYVSPL
ncbi:MAG TPA: glycoside hydrolase family 3 protein, partial [Caulobacterales bacterium]|nr:glycoside hydrolase family 3 protein [Caulobacterales bacterium]